MGASSLSHTEGGAQKGSAFKKKGHQKVYTVLSGEGAGGLEVGIFPFFSPIINDWSII